MYRRNVGFKLKVKRMAEFTCVLQGQITPLLRRQKGFEDEITFVAPERNEAAALSLWDKKYDAEAYKRGTCPDVLKALSKVVEGAPRVGGPSRLETRPPTRSLLARSDQTDLPVRGGGIALLRIVIMKCRRVPLELDE